jgi:hypothetical protein
MVTVTSRDRASYTSGGALNLSKTFRLNIEADGDEYENLSVFETLRVSARVLEGEDELTIDVSDRMLEESDLVYTDEVSVGAAIVLKYVSQHADLPATIYLPNSTTSRIQPAFDVLRGPLHPHKSVPVPVELTVEGLQSNRS